MTLFTYVSAYCVCRDISDIHEITDITVGISFSLFSYSDMMNNKTKIVSFTEWKGKQDISLFYYTRHCG